MYWSYKQCVLISASPSILVTDNMTSAVFPLRCSSRKDWTILNTRSVSPLLRGNTLVLTYLPVTLVKNATDTIPAPADFGLTNTTTRSNAAAYLAALSGNCGTVPSNASPSNSATVPVWSQQAAARAKAAGQTLRATGTPAKRHKRSKRGHN